MIRKYHNQQIADTPMAPQGRATQQSRDTRKTKKQINQLSLPHQDDCMINTTSERLNARNFLICRYFSFYEQLKFSVQLS